MTKAKGPEATASDPLTLSGGTPEGATGTLQQTVKPVGVHMTEDHRYYWNGEGPLPSVTTVLKVMDKPAVTAWVARETAKAAWRNPVNLLNPGTEAEYVNFLLAQPKEVTDVAAKLGSSIHLLADSVGRDRTPATALAVPDEAIPYLEGFRGFLAFLEAHRGIVVSSEKAVISRYGYGGTYDLLLQYEDALWLVDLKTGRGYYPDFALQLAAYGMADFIALPGDPTEYPMPRVERYGILHLRPDQYPDTGWRLVEYPITDRDQRAFLAALDLYQWTKEGRFTKSILNKAIAKGTV